jgi:predicted RecA/RadA family phage recombinase
MSTNQVQRGDVIDWVNGTGVATVSGQVVRVGQALGVCLVNIAIAGTGAVALRGVFTVPKVSAAVIVQGEALSWDASAAAFDDNAATPATGDVQGPPAIAYESAGNGVTSFDVMFTGVPGTVT